jgi:battenin
MPKSMVLLFDVLPSLLTKLVAPYLLHLIPYSTRITLLVVAPAVAGMLLIALSPGGTTHGEPDTQASTIAIKMVGVMLASFASGAGELSFLGLTHFYGRWSLAAWGSGTGAAGLVGAGAYVVATTWIGWSVRTSLLAFATLPLGLLVCWFGVLPREVLSSAKSRDGYEAVAEEENPESEELQEDERLQTSTSALIASESLALSHSMSSLSFTQPTFSDNIRRVKRLFFPYMLPLFLVYVAEYTINQGISPTLLFPLSSSPFASYRAFYPTYAAIYQAGVFISRSSIAFIRIPYLYPPSLLQFLNVVLLTAHAVFDFLPSVWIVFVIIFWEGLLGGLVYVSTFAEIADKVPVKDREFSLSATSVSDSAGICVAGFVGMAMEVWLCTYQVRHGRDYCKRI